LSNDPLTACEILFSPHGLVLGVLPQIRDMAQAPLRASRSISVCGLEQLISFEEMPLPVNA